MGCEPGQVRKEAAISSFHRVPQENLTGAGSTTTPRSELVEDGFVAPFYFAPVLILPSLKKD